MSQPNELEALFVSHLAAIDRIVASLCRRHGLRADDADDFASWAKERLIDDDYAILRKFRGEAALTTYLTVVLAMLFRDYRVHHWGRWRPSAAARRLGATATMLERLVHRDGHSLAQAGEILRSSGVAALSDRELGAMLRELPRRDPLRPLPAGDDALASQLSDAAADALVEEESANVERQRAHDAIERAMARLPDEDRLMLRMRFWQDMSIADIARVLGTPQKPLYRRLDRALAQLRDELRRSGVSSEIMESLGAGQPEWR